MTCTKCGNELSPQAKFCPLCGTPAPEDVKIPRFCMYCGNPVDSDTQFCEHCGKKIAPVEDSPAEETNSIDPNELSAPQSHDDRPSAPVSAPAPAPVSAAPAASAVVPAAAAAAASPVAAAVKAEVVHAAGKAATGSVRSAGKIAKRIAIWTAVVAFVIGLATACLSYFVSSPEDTVEELFSAIEDFDYEAMLGCMDSKTESQFKAILGISGDLFGSITGIGLDFEDLLALAPSLAPSTGLDMPDMGDYEVETVLYTDYSAQKIQQICEQANNGEPIESGYLSDNEIISFLHKYHITLPGLENLLAKTAIVKVIDDSGIAGYLPMVNEGYGDWRILMPDLLSSFYE